MERNTMKNWFPHLITVFAVGAAVQVTAQPQVIAQTYLEEKNPMYPEHTADAFSRAINYEQRNTDESFDAWPLINEYFGLFPLSFDGAGYPEQQAKRDIRKVDILYRDMMLQQVASDPVLRTPDLANPFNSSLLTEAPARSGTLPLLRGTGFTYDR